jgi:hypothetical protein
MLVSGSLHSFNPLVPPAVGGRGRGQRARQLEFNSVCSSYYCEAELTTYGIVHLLTGNLGDVSTACQVVVYHGCGSLCNKMAAVARQCDALQALHATCSLPHVWY